MSVTKPVRILGVATVLAALVFAVIVAAPPLSGQSRPPIPAPPPPPPAPPRVEVFGGGSRIGASVRDVDPPDRREGGGVYVENVRPGSPAERAGMRPADVITRFDGETVRSARQFGRLVQETPAGRAVIATVVRDGRSTDLTVTPEEDTRAGVIIDRERLQFDRRRFDEQMNRLRDRLRNLPFDFNLDLDLELDAQRFGPSPRLGVTVEELTPQLAAYFGAKNGVLVASVADDSPASRAGLRAGDVIRSVNGQTISSRNELTRALRAAGSTADVTLDIVRDKKDMSLKARLDAASAPRPRPRPVRPVKI